MNKDQLLADLWKSFYAVSTETLINNVAESRLKILQLTAELEELRNKYETKKEA